MGDGDVDSSTHVAKKVVTAGLKAAGRGMKSLVGREVEEEEEKCVDVNLNFWKANKDVEKKKDAKETFGVRECDDNFWGTQKFVALPQEKRDFDMEWGVVDESVFVNQPVDGGGTLVPVVEAGVRMYGGTICGTLMSEAKTECFQYVGRRCGVRVRACICVDE